jgi:hypothetical protein
MRQKNLAHGIAVGIIIALAGGLAVGLAGCENSAGSGGAGAAAGGTGQVYIGFARSGGAVRTVVPDEAELQALTIKVTFTGPGGTIEKTFDRQGGTVVLAAGSWRLTAKACGPDRLRAIAGETLQVKSGGTHNIAMTACIGIKSEADLSAALGAGGLPGIGHDTTSGKGDLLVLEKDITLNSAVTLSTAAPFTLVSEPGARRTLTRWSAASVIALPAGASLTLGGESGELIINNAGQPGGMFRKGGSLFGTAGFGDLVLGSSASIINAACSVTTSGEWAAAVQAVNESLALDGGYIIDIGTSSFSLPTSGDSANPRLRSGAVLALKGSGTINQQSGSSGDFLAIDSGVTLTLDGPTLSGNTTDGSVVFVAGGATFTLKNGIIRGGVSSTGGGGVFVSGTFSMSGGTITGNTASQGSGVMNGDGGVFNMSGGEISLNTSSLAEGAAVSTSGDFFMSGGTITRNESSGCSGVYVIFGGIFTMSGGTITNNTSTSLTAVGIGVHISSTGSFICNLPAPQSSISANTKPDGTEANVYGGEIIINGVPGTWW